MPSITDIPNLSANDPFSVYSFIGEVYQFIVTKYFANYINLDSPCLLEMINMIAICECLSRDVLVYRLTLCLHFPPLPSVASAADGGNVAENNSTKIIGFYCI